MDKGLGGGLVWSVETDDFTGGCGGGVNPLLTSIMSTLNGGALPSTPAPPPTTVSPVTYCKTPGYIRDPNNCSIYYQCVSNGQGGYNVYTYSCPSGLLFDTVTTTCTWPSSVTGCSGDSSATTTTTAAAVTTTTTTPTTAATTTITTTKATAATTTAAGAVTTTTATATTTTTTTSSPTGEES